MSFIAENEEKLGELFKCKVCSSLFEKEVDLHLHLIAHCKDLYLTDE